MSLLKTIKRRCAPLWGALTLIFFFQSANAQSVNAQSVNTQSANAQSAGDSLRCTSLTQADYEKIAAELNIPIAAIRAVVEIEAGLRGEGFNSNHTPIINFDLTMFRQAARRQGININDYRQTHPIVFSPPNRRRFGSTQAAQYARLDSAMTIDSVAAMEGTFWGMFQIGGFNWKLCGCSSINDFVNRMKESELSQLEIFAAFIKGRHLDKYIRARDWAGFSLRYNGPGYQRMNYDTRMAAAFERFSKQSE